MIKLKTKVNYLKSLNLSKLKNCMSKQLKAYLTEDESKYITLQRTACVKQYDDNGKFLGDEFKINIPDKNVDMKIFIPTDKTLFTIQMGNYIYGFKIDHDM